MSRFRRSLVSGLLVVLSSQAVLADVIVLRKDSTGDPVSSQTFANNTPVAIDASGWSGGDWLHVYATGDPTDPANSIGTLTLTGTPTGGGRLNVAVTGASQAIPIEFPRASIEVGAFNFSGLNFAPGVNGRNVYFYGRVAGSFTGTINCGKAERVDARLDINGIRALAGDTIFDPDDYRNVPDEERSIVLAINQVRAGRAITGEIRADEGGIDRIVVRNAGAADGDPTNDGILADIQAPMGLIRQIYTMSQIGTEINGVITRRNITALRGVRYLRAVDGEVVPLDPDPANPDDTGALPVPFRAVAAAGLFL